VDCSIRGDQGEGIVRLGGIFLPLLQARRLYTPPPVDPFRRSALYSRRILARGEGARREFARMR
jgi:hypothetical protein